MRDFYGLVVIGKRWEIYMYSIIYVFKFFNFREIFSIKYFIVFFEVKVSRGVFELGGNDFFG